MGNNIDSSRHCNIFASSGPRPPTVPRRTPLGPRVQQLEAPHPRPRSRVSEAINSQFSQSHNGCCTMRPRVHCPPGREGDQCQCYTPSHLADGWRDRGYVLCLMFMSDCISAKLWLHHFISKKSVPLFTFQFELELPRGKIYNWRLLFWI